MSKKRRPKATRSGAPAQARGAADARKAGEEDGGSQAGVGHGQAPGARHRHVQPQARLLEDRGAQGPQAQGEGRQLRRPEARSVAAALGLPARARRRAQELGGAQGPEPRPRREPAGDAHRRPPARLRRVRRHHPQGRIWRRHGDVVGPGPLGPRAGQGPEQDDRGRPPSFHARWRADERRVGDVPDEAQAGREGRAVDAQEGHRRLSPIPTTATRWSTIA